MLNVQLVYIQRINKSVNDYIFLSSAIHKVIIDYISFYVLIVAN